MLHAQNSHERYLTPGRHLGASGFDGPVNGRMSDGNEKNYMKNFANKPISKKERLRRAALGMRNQQPKSIANNRMKKELYWLVRKGILKMPP